MNKINILSPDVVNQIAAGEVVERPAAAVKELIENSLDAKASSVSVEIMGGGLTLIRVVDDGVGMGPDDLKVCTLRHATSKLATFTDLFSITSLGFRGEALPSMAAVSRLTIRSKTEGSDNGHEITVLGGEPSSVETVGMPQGTMVEIKDLFYNTPARLKFMKSETAESQRILQTVERLALSRPDVSFSLKIDQRIVLQAPGNTNLMDAAAAVFGASAARDMKFIEGSREEDIGVLGLLGLPKLNRNNRSWQALFLNGRYIEHRGLSYAIDEAYRSLLPTKRFPVAVLHLTIDPQEVDINVHPTKVEVRFREERRVVGFLITALRREVEKIGQLKTSTPPSMPELEGKIEVGGEVRRHNENVQSVNLDFFSTRPMTFNRDVAPGVASPSVLPAVKNYRLIGQVLNSYILLERDKGLCIVDQHAAHERILYEQFLQAREGSIQQLAVPLSIDFGATAHFLPAYLEQFGKAGFELEHFGGTTYLLRSIPDTYKGDFSESVIIDMLSELGQGHKVDSKDKIIVSMACRAAIKANTRLSPAEMIELVDMYQACRLPVTCPHGRPVEITYGEQELFKLFHPR